MFKNYSSFINPKFNLDSNSKKYISQQASKVNSLICFKDSTYTWAWDTLSVGWAVLPFSKATYTNNANGYATKVLYRDWNGN